jgi:cell division transport system permease protein
MSLAYTLRESISGFTRTKLSTTTSIMTISISLLFRGIFAVINTQTSRFIDALRDQVELEAFLNEPITAKDLSAAQERIKSLAGVQGITYISKDAAAKLFQKEFGENILNVLEFNPLPASLKISLKDGYKTSARVAEVIKD